MKDPEQNLWVRIQSNMLPWYKQLWFQRFEDMTHSGVPDVCWNVNGIVTWMELKQRREWPARAATAVLGDKGLNQDQKNWHMAYSQARGRVCTLVGVGSFEYFLVDAWASDEINNWSRQDLQEHSMLTGDTRRGKEWWANLYKFLSAGK